MYDLLALSQRCNVNAYIERDRDTNDNGIIDERLTVLQDANFNVTSIAGITSGTIFLRFVYDANGAKTTLNASWATTSDGYDMLTGFQGGKADIVTGYIHFDHRELNTSQMRWMSEDPAGYVDGPDLYQIAGSAPENHLDPYGTYKLTLTFQAFIPKSKGINPNGNPLPQNNWGEEPYQDIYTFGKIPEFCARTFFSTDDRERVGDPGTSRLSSIAEFDTNDILHLEKPGAVTFKTVTGESHRAILWTANGGNTWTYSKNSIEAKRATPKATYAVHDMSSCSFSSISISASASYPFDTASPSIDYNVTWNIKSQNGRVAIETSGSHNRFPAYGSTANGNVIYDWYSLSSGPGLINLGLTWHNFKVNWTEVSK